MEEGGASEELMTGGIENAGSVVRIGNTIRRPRTPGSDVVEALLLHLERVSYDYAPRFLGIDREGRQILEFIEGSATGNPSWQADDEENARQLGLVAAQHKQLHRATESFQPPSTDQPRRPLPLPGKTWSHADSGYSNLVYRDSAFVGFIDWEFAAPAHHLYDPAGLVAMSATAPRPDATDTKRRANAARLAMYAVAEGYGMDDAERADLPRLASIIIDDAVDYWAASQPSEVLDAWRWRSRWFSEIASTLD